MAKISKELENKIKKFIELLEISDIHIEQAFLFGSYAKGNQNKWSDIDLALVSRKFEGNRYYDMDKLTEARFAVDTDITALPYRPEDFTPDDLFVKEILKTGIRII